MESIVELTAWAVARGLVMLRVEPEGPVELAESLIAAGFQRGSTTEAKRTAIVRLDDEETMLPRFRKTTRANLRKAASSDLIVDEVEHTGELSRLVSITAQRQGVYITGAAFHRAVREKLSQTHIYVVRYGDDLLAAALIVYHDRRAYYLIAGSSGLERERMPNYLLQRRAMQDAYRAGCLDYDLVGLPATDDPGDPQHNLLQFKSGFGGTVVDYTGAWDLVLSPTPYMLMRRLHRLRVRGQRLVARARRATLGER